MRLWVAALVAAGAIAAWLGVGALLVSGTDREGPVDVADTTVGADSEGGRSLAPEETAAEEYARDLVVRLTAGDADGPAKVLAALPASLDPAALRRIEADVVALATVLRDQQVASVQSEPADGMAAGEPG